MRCPFCGVEDTHVKDSRTNEDSTAVRRRRYCIECNGRFTTFEKIQPREFIVIKKNGEKRMFDREKIARSIDLAVRKRGVSNEEVEMMVNRIILNLEKSLESTVTTDLIGELVMEELSKIDKIAYVRYASVYREFCEVKDFEKFIQNLNKMKNEEL
jgi:transcriptional repressor NrdR